MTDLYRLAEKNIRISSVYPAVHGMCRDYRALGEADFEVVTDGADIAFEREKSAREDRAEGLPIRQYEEPYLETLAVYRKIAEIAEAAGAVILKTELLTRIFSHQCTFVLERLGAPKARLYGTTVEVAGLGVMLEGAPGLGKSETALGLIKRGNALVADDFTCLRKDMATNTLFASAAEATRNHMEIRGIGIIHVPSIFGVTAVCPEKRLDLVITFKSMKETEGELDRTGQDRMTRTILGVEIPQLIIPVAAGRDLVNLVETAAQQYKLLAAGYDAAAELDARLRARAVAKSKGK